MEQIIKISAYILESFLHIWPYLLVTIPFAVGIKFTGASKYINMGLSKSPYMAILIATAIGALSPFCSCGIIPVIASLLIGGMPLAPVMSFWIASPSMDPEIFLLSGATIGWNLSVWRLVATFVISLSAGFITHFAVKKNFFGDEILKSNHGTVQSESWKSLVLALKKAYAFLTSQKIRVMQMVGLPGSKPEEITVNCCIAAGTVSMNIEVEKECKGCSCEDTAQQKTETTYKKLLRESWNAFSMVAKFMALAFLINALIEFYVPEYFLIQFLGVDSPFSVPIASLIGMPFYTSNLTALPLISGMLAMGMNPGAALSFLIAGPVTTLPAMMAVWGIVRPKVFYMYLLFSLMGAVIFGYLFNILN